MRVFSNSLLYVGAINNLGWLIIGIMTTLNFFFPFAQDGFFDMVFIVMSAMSFCFLGFMYKDLFGRVGKIYSYARRIILVRILFVFFMFFLGEFYAPSEANYVILMLVAFLALHGICSIFRFRTEL